MVHHRDGPTGGPKINEEVGMLKAWEDSELEYWDSCLNISGLFDYDAGTKPQNMVQAILDRVEEYKAVQPSVWLHLQPIKEVVREAHELYMRWQDTAKRRPRWGVPFSVKESINIAEIPTTTGCPLLAFTSTDSAPLATGMTGCQSPYGTLHSTFGKSHVVGGSSSGSAVTTIDAFAKLPSQIRTVRKTFRRLRLHFGFAPERALESCSSAFWEKFYQVVKEIAKAGGNQVDIDWKSFEAANALYNSTFVLERLTMFPDRWYVKNKQFSHPVIRQDLEGAVARQSTYTAVNVFKDLRKQAGYKCAVERTLNTGEIARGSMGEGDGEIILILVPTTPFHATIEEVENDPVAINNRRGIFTYFANVLDLVGDSH
ncbi:hypothetical protein QTJ16_004083 [Diplocarpon rosae]|uniref:Amidase n=1 Tax=Diplocarpon rosae TaxID=946125 RepID=A0AAD9T142_9HELO|nr:hypothetical protein QTJ16_004083 [Diplocarpon rosae]